MYGTQTSLTIWICNLLFENDVKMYGTQTKRGKDVGVKLFENDVKMYGTQTSTVNASPACGLRMM